jgi:histidine ammonia-lyase
MRYQHHLHAWNGEYSSCASAGCCACIQSAFHRSVTSVVGMHEWLVKAIQRVCDIEWNRTVTKGPRFFGGGGQAVDTAQFHSRIIALADALSVAGRDTGKLLLRIIVTYTS